MGIPVRTGRVCGSYGCRWCGQEVETVVYEVRDAGALGDEVMCCVCGKHQYRWGESTCARKAGEYAEKDRQWNRDIHNEFLRDIAFWAWLAARIIRLAARPEPMSPEQAAWVRDNVLPRRVVETHAPVQWRCACQKGLSQPCREGRHDQCAHHKLAAHYARGEAECSLGRSYSPWSVTWPGFVSVDIWLADRVCVWRCPCDCHTPPQPPPFTEPDAWADGALFDLGEAPC